MPVAFALFAADDCDLIATILGGNTAGVLPAFDIVPPIVVDAVIKGVGCIISLVESLIVDFMLSFKSVGTIIGCCDKITGCGADVIVDVLIIGLICVDPTFIVGVDC